MRPTTPYSADLGDREPLDAIRENADRVRTLTGGWTEPQFERTYAPGKWTARQILTHLAQTEMALGTRARMALSTPDYVAQRFDQNAWVARESRLTGPDAVGAFVALSQMNRALFENLDARRPADRHGSPRIWRHHGGLDRSPAGRSCKSTTCGSWRW